MPESLVTIEDVESKTIPTKYGQKTVWNVKASDGRRYGTFDAELGQLAGRLRGQAAVIEYRERQKGEYTNYDIEALRASEFNPVAGESRDTPKAQEGVRQAPVASYGPSDKDSSIARAVALKAAVELAAGGVIEDPTPDGLLTVSEVFTDWLLTGEGSPKATVVPINSDPGDESEYVDTSLVKF